MPKHTERAVSAEIIEQKIYFIRSHKVMLDSDLAALYGVETKTLNRAVKRNLSRFPGDFMFQLTGEEAKALRFQFGASKEGRGGRRYLPYAFTQEGVAMLSSVLTSERAIQVNLAIMRVFVKVRTLIATHADLIRRLDEMEEKYDEQFGVVFEAIRELVAPEPVPPSRRIGFNRENKPVEEGEAAD